MWRLKNLDYLLLELHFNICDYSHQEDFNPWTYFEYYLLKLNLTYIVQVAPLRHGPSSHGSVSEN